MGQGSGQGPKSSAEADSATVPTTLTPRSRRGEGNGGPKSSLQSGQEEAPHSLWAWKEEAGAVETVKCIKIT